MDTKLKYYVNTQVTPEGEISQSIDTELQEVRVKLSTEIMRLKDEGVTQALQRLGWMPPDRAQEVLDVLRQIICDLPANRDWLDPELEMRAKEILRHETETRSTNSDKLHKEVAEGPQGEGEGAE